MENPASETQRAFFLRSYTVWLSPNSLRCTFSGSAASPWPVRRYVIAATASSAMEQSTSRAVSAARLRPINS